MNNINRVNDLLNSMNETLHEIAILYYKDFCQDEKAEDYYRDNTMLTKTLLRRLVMIAENKIIPEIFYISSFPHFSILRDLPKKCQSNLIHNKIKVISNDGSHYLRFFVDVPTEKLPIIFDRSLNIIRNIEEQEIILSSRRNNIVEKASFSKAILIKELKKHKINYKDIIKICDKDILERAIEHYRELTT
jgi:hypothetical protein